MDKLPPHDTDAEEAVIGSLLIDGDNIRLVENKLSSVDFYTEGMRGLYDGCISLRARREVINQITLAQELDRQGKLQQCGGAAMVRHLVSICGTSFDVEYYADIVYRLSVSRQIVMLGNKIMERGYKAEPDVSTTTAGLLDMLSNFRKGVVIFDELFSPKDVANITLDMIDEYNNPKHSIAWGFVDLDNLTSGIFPELIIFGARPSIGKTQILLDILENVVNQGYKALFCSAEMGIKGLMERKIARDLQVDIRLLRKSGLPPDLMTKLADLAGKISEQQVYYLPQGVSSQDIYAEAAKLKDTKGLDIVFVDYLQILKDCWQSGRESKNVLVGRASKVLKSLVNDLQIPVICASQLSRDLERRSEEHQKPVLADLRESGDIEQDSDVVFLLWRNLIADEESERNILEVKMAKNRQLGDAPFIKLTWLPTQHRYADTYKQ